MFKIVVYLKQQLFFIKSCYLQMLAVLCGNFNWALWYWRYKSPSSL